MCEIPSCFYFHFIDKKWMPQQVKSFVQSHITGEGGGQDMPPEPALFPLCSWIPSARVGLGGTPDQNC